jgi:hypothetical protein
MGREVKMAWPRRRRSEVRKGLHVWLVGRALEKK